ncbi:MAG: hypothetical protein LBM27_05790 [Lactobacillaceae bacterium]|jgi:hypothetical protein|nr:hypothetical protein [Lactobacillaceae bacterium]
MLKKNTRIILVVATIVLPLFIVLAWSQLLNLWAQNPKTSGIAVSTVLWLGYAGYYLFIQGMRRLQISNGIGGGLILTSQMWNIMIHMQSWEWTLLNRFISMTLPQLLLIVGFVYLITDVILKFIKPKESAKFWTWNYALTMAMFVTFWATFRAPNATIGFVDAGLPIPYFGGSDNWLPLVITLAFVAELSIGIFQFVYSIWIKKTASIVFSSIIIVFVLLAFGVYLLFPLGYWIGLNPFMMAPILVLEILVFPIKAKDKSR